MAFGVEDVDDIFFSIVFLCLSDLTAHISFNCSDNLSRLETLGCLVIIKHVEGIQTEKHGLITTVSFII